MGTTDTGRIRRFTPWRVAEHWLHVGVFFTLAATGLAQKFAGVALARRFIMAAGGIDAVRLTHRGAGVVFAVLLGLHVAVAVAGVVFLRWQPSMLVTRRDVESAVHNIKYYCGLLSARARCARFDYKQKFVYWLVLTGGLLMAATGFSLWWPTWTAEVIAGQAIPAAKALHSNHALLVLLLIALWHMYDSAFSPDVFPLDTTMFSGYISRDRMAREHPVELARIEGVPEADDEDGSGQRDDR